MQEKNKLILEKLKPLIGLLIFSVIISFISPRFATSSNILNVLRQTSINAIIAAGMTFVILTGGIDLSVGSVLAFSSAVCAYLLASGYNLFICIGVAILIGALSGLFNAIIITKGKVQPFIATLATMTLLRGATLVFTDGRPISVAGANAISGFRYIGAGAMFGIPVPIIVMLFIFIVCWHLLMNTSFGRHLYAVGGNEEAAALSGLRTDRIKASAYIINGMLSALAGIILTARLVSAQPTAGSGYELDAIAAVVLGGTSLSGGQGSVVGTIIGALIIGILNNALNLMNVSAYYQMIAKAIVILIAVLLDRKEK
ncbi:ribose transport system permease protein [Acetoanaerobium pronyense]|uniref:Ribose transport system permease protein n=1 Tax=Acetoanaerobium pronyense TaxID=1482736 RepID=A0ABS4KMC2_9FIRM|nr:ribose ABC transporter permease [Acetoanaerobium pronyense]MBP2028306.1 ribose transport system permease protein [Acetoanaerobium pronyense]